MPQNDLIEIRHEGALVATVTYEPERRVLRIIGIELQAIDYFKDS